MIRRISLVILLATACAPCAWPKFGKEEQQYLDDQFKAVQDQIQALVTQLQSLNAQLTELRQTQSRFQVLIVRQQRELQDLDDMVKSMRLGGEDNFTNLKAAIAQLRNETQAAFKSLTGQAAPPAAASTAAAAAPKPAALAPKPIQGYVTAVEANNVVSVDLGSQQGLQQGTRLVVFKATDPNTRVGLVEVTQVLDAGSSRCRIVQMNSGIRPEFGDMVRLE
jgi:Skp family chaperone for outer membrane proteins